MLLQTYWRKTRLEINKILSLKTVTNYLTFPYFIKKEKVYQIRQNVIYLTTHATF